MTLFLDNFNGPFDPSDPNSNYMFFSVPGAVTANDGTTSVNGSSLTINSSPFTFSLPNSLDHVKYLVFKKTPFQTVLPGREILFEATMSGKQTYPQELPSPIVGIPGSLEGVYEPLKDPRVCCTAFNVVDFTNLLVFDFIITDKLVYALVERLPFNLPQWGGSQTYNSYTHLIPVYERPDSSDPLEDMLNLGISYNYTTGLVKWYINEKEVFRIDKPGYFLDSKYRVTQITPIGTTPYPQTVVRSPNLWVGFGTFSLLEASYPINHENLSNKGLVDFSMGGYFPYANANAVPITQPSVQLHYMTNYVGLGNTTVFGQGAQLKIKKLKVSTRPANDKFIPTLVN